MKRVLVSGKVQGVSFRDGAKRKAEELGVVGWVRNLDDGRVEFGIDGENAGKMIDWISEGPPSAEVRKVEVSEMADPERPIGFEIKE